MVPPCFAAQLPMPPLSVRSYASPVTGFSVELLPCGSSPLLRDHVHPPSSYPFSAAGILCKGAQRATLLFFAFVKQYLIPTKPTGCWVFHLPGSWVNITQQITNVKRFSSLKIYPMIMIFSSSVGSGLDVLSAGGFSQGLLGSGSVGSQPRQLSLSEISGALGLPRGPGSSSL